MKPLQCRWAIGSFDWPLKPVDCVPLPHPAGVDVTTAPPGPDLGQLLEEGKINARTSADAPKCILEKSPKVAQLFPDYVATERGYYQRTDGHLPDDAHRGAAQGTRRPAPRACPSGGSPAKTFSGRS